MTRQLGWDTMGPWMAYDPELSLLGSKLAQLDARGGQDGSGDQGWDERSR